MYMQHHAAQSHPSGGKRLPSTRAGAPSGNRHAWRVSCDSPLGQASMHRRVSDVVEVKTPIEPRKLTVLYVDEFSHTDLEGAI